MIPVPALPRWPCLWHASSTRGEEGSPIRRPPISPPSLKSEIRRGLHLVFPRGARIAPDRPLQGSPFEEGMVLAARRAVAIIINRRPFWFPVFVEPTFETRSHRDDPSGTFKQTAHETSQHVKCRQTERAHQPRTPQDRHFQAHTHIINRRALPEGAPAPARSRRGGLALAPVS